MARFNTQQTTISITAGTTLTYVLDKATILLSGAAGYTLTLASPVPFPGTIQSIYNATGGNVTIATAAGSIIGNGFISGSNQIIPNNTTYTVTSDGANYIVTNNQGGPISVTAGTFDGAVIANSSVTMSPANANIAISPSGTGTVTISPTGALTINPTAASSINNTSIGASTRGSGAFTTLAANDALTLTGSITANTSTNSQSFTTTGAGTITITAGTLGTINNMSIGQTTAAAGAFTTATASNAPTATTHLTRKDYVDSQIAIQNAKAFYYNFV